MPSSDPSTQPGYSGSSPLGYGLAMNDVSKLSP